MVCIGTRNLTAMAVFFNPSSRFRRKSMTRKQMSCCGYGWRYSLCLRVKASATAGSESCMAVKENIADEEGYIKAGGSELLFIQMQQNKSMDMRSKLADKLPPISLGGDILDLFVISCGPAGLALAAESAKLGLKVGLIGPDLPFTNNYGEWEDEFKGLGLEGCIEHVWQYTIVYLDDKDPILIGRAYGRVSGHRLVTVASGAASGKLLQYEVGGPKVSVQTAYCVEVEETCLASKDAMPFDLLKKKLFSRLNTMGIRITETYEEEWSYILVGGSFLNTEQKNLAFGAAANMVYPATVNMECSLGAYDRS